MTVAQQRAHMAGYEGGVGEKQDRAANVIDLNYCYQTDYPIIGGLGHSQKRSLVEGLGLLTRRIPAPRHQKGFLCSPKLVSVSVYSTPEVNGTEEKTVGIMEMTRLRVPGRRCSVAALININRTGSLSDIILHVVCGNCTTDQL